MILKVKEVRGTCPVFKGGERIVISGPEIDLEKTDRICIHALTPILHFALALREGASPVHLGLSESEDRAFIQCPDPGPPFTSGGTVVFEVALER
jgi:uncharacterized repeat protein (TIGR04076 family)